MEDLTEHNSPVLEFKPTKASNEQEKTVDSSTGAIPKAKYATKSIATDMNKNVCVQTEAVKTDISVYDKKLASFLRTIYPELESELVKTPTPFRNKQFGDSTDKPSDKENIETYQKITIPGLPENSQGMAIWLSVHTNNAPVLVVTTTVPHDDYCEHVNQILKLYVPIREANNFIAFIEVLTIPVRGCVRSLCTNYYNKNMFAGSTMYGDIYVWELEIKSKTVDIKQIDMVTSEHGYAVAMDWAPNNQLYTAHGNGNVIKWIVDENILEKDVYNIKLPLKASNEITTLVCLSDMEFAIGTKDGGVYHCSSANISAIRPDIQIVPMKKHRFMITSLLKTKISGHQIVISCDLSGEIFYHDTRFEDDDLANCILQMPLPFKNVIAISTDSAVLYSPGKDGALDCYHIQTSKHSIIKGALCGKGNYIKCSDNGCWIITGLYGSDFQIFYVDN